MSREWIGGKKKGGEECGDRLMLLQQFRKAMKVAGTKLVAVRISEYELKLRKNYTTQ